jgi:hypothetical protein
MMIYLFGLGANYMLTLLYEQYLIDFLLCRFISVRIFLTCSVSRWFAFPHGSMQCITSNHSLWSIHHSDVSMPVRDWVNVFHRNFREAGWRKDWGLSECDALSLRECFRSFKGRFTFSVPPPCRAAKGLERVFPIWFTQCGRVWFTLAMPRSDRAVLLNATAQSRRRETACERPARYRLLPATTRSSRKVVIRSILLSGAGGQCEIKQRSS